MSDNNRFEDEQVNYSDLIFDWGNPSAPVKKTVRKTAPQKQKEEPVKEEAQAVNEAEKAAEEAAKAAIPALDQLDRTSFNHAAMRLNLPIFWVYEETPSKEVRPELLTTLNFFPTELVWKDENGKFTKDFYDAYQKMVDIMKDPLRGAEVGDAEKTRLTKVADELDQGAVTLVATDFSKSSDDEKKSK